MPKQFLEGPEIGFAKFLVATSKSFIRNFIGFGTGQTNFAGLLKKYNLLSSDESRLCGDGI